MSGVPFDSIPDMLRNNATQFVDHLALKYRRQGKLQLLTYPQLYERALTLNPAKAIGLMDRGAIRTGCTADLVLVRQDAEKLPHAEAVYRNSICGPCMDIYSAPAN